MVPAPTIEVAKHNAVGLLDGAVLNSILVFAIDSRPAALLAVVLELRAAAFWAALRRDACGPGEKQTDSYITY